MNNDYPQDLMADLVYVESGGEPALAESLEQAERDHLVDDPDDLGVYEPLFATMISRHMSHQEYTVYSRGVVAHSDDTTYAFRFLPKGEELVQKWVGDVMSEGASIFSGESATLGESSSEPSGGTKMLYNYWGQTNVLAGHCRWYRGTCNCLQDAPCSEEDTRGADARSRAFARGNRMD